MPEAMTAREVCKFLHISEPTLYNWIRKGKLKRYLNPVGTGLGGRRAYFLRKDVETLKAQIVRLKK